MFQSPADAFSQSHCGREQKGLLGRAILTSQLRLSTISTPLSEMFTSFNQALLTLSGQDVRKIDPHDLLATRRLAEVK